MWNGWCRQGRRRIEGYGGGADIGCTAVIAYGTTARHGTHNTARSHDTRSHNTRSPPHTPTTTQPPGHSSEMRAGPCPLFPIDCQHNIEAERSARPNRSRHACGRRSHAATTHVSTQPEESFHHIPFSLWRFAKKPRRVAHPNTRKHANIPGQRGGCPGTM